MTPSDLVRGTAVAYERHPCLFLLFQLLPQPRRRRAHHSRPRAWVWPHPCAFAGSIYPPSHPHLAWPAAQVCRQPCLPSEAFLAFFPRPPHRIALVLGALGADDGLSCPPPPRPQRFSSRAAVTASHRTCPRDLARMQPGCWGSVGEQLKEQLPGPRPCVRPGGPSKQKQHRVLDRSSVREPQGQPTAGHPGI